MFFVIPIPRIRVRTSAAVAQPVVQPAYFALTPTVPGGETALFQDNRVGFSHALPGWPEAAHVLGGPGEPHADAMIQFWDFPLWIRYKLDRATASAPSATHFALDYAARYLAARTRDGTVPQPAPVHRLQAWGVDGAAVASYTLAYPDPRGATHEDLTVLARQGAVMVVTRRHIGAAQDWLRHATFRAVVDATLLWNPQRYRYAPRIWPDSTFLKPVLVPELWPQRLGSIPQIAPLLQLPAHEATAFGQSLQKLLRSEEPPWFEVVPEARATWMNTLASSVTSVALQQALIQAFAEVRTWHDFRGLALMLGMAMPQ